MDIEFSVLPKRRDAWGRNTSRTIGIYGVQTRWGGADDSLKKSLSAKAKHYGHIDYPFLIAVNCLSGWVIDKEEERAALFGTTEEFVPAYSDQLAVRQRPNGFWGIQDYPKYTRVSGVILGVALPYSIPKYRPCLYHNPWAGGLRSDVNWPFEQATWENGDVRYAPGIKSMADVLQLPENWPGILFDHEP